VLTVEEDIPTHLQFLRKILRAVDLDFDTDIHFLITPAGFRTHLLSDPNLKVYRHVLIFGIPNSHIGLQGGPEPSCAAYTFDQCTCITAPALGKISGNPELKKALWSALKAHLATHEQ
jgi:DNA polymerase III psi subunit